jgi:hypothetical protein
MQTPKDKDLRTGDILCKTIPTSAKVYEGESNMAA